MFCHYCGREISEKAAFCPYCGREVLKTDADSEDRAGKEPLQKYKKRRTNRKSTSRKNVFLLIGILVVVLVLFFACFDKKLLLHDDKYDDISEKDFNDYISYDDQFLDIEAKYLNDNGYVMTDDIPLLLDEIEKVAQTGKVKGVIKDYTRDSGNIYIEFSSGINYLFIPLEEDRLSGGEGGKILTVEPVVGIVDNIALYDYRLATFLTKLSVELEYKGSFLPIGNASLIKETFDDLYEYSIYARENGTGARKYSLREEEVTVESMKKWSQYKVIIFEGHGAHNSKLHSCLKTGECFVGFEEFSKYKDDIKNDNIVLTSFPKIIGTDIPYSPVRQYCITSKFVYNYFGEMDDSLIFLGACSSAKDDVLAKELLNKGAAVVIGYSEDTYMMYEMMTRTMFFYGLTKVNEQGEYFTVAQALDYAKQCMGSSDLWGDCGSEMVCFSKNNVADQYTLKGNIKNEKPLIVTITDDDEPDDQDEKSSEVPDYSPVLEQYQDALNHHCYLNEDGTIDYDAAGEYVGLEILVAARYYKNYGDEWSDENFYMYYALSDLNEDGRDELFIGGGTEDSVEIYDVFTHDGEQPVPLFEVGGFGYRYHLTVLDDDTLAVNGSGGANCCYITYYQLQQHSCEPVLLAEYSWWDGRIYEYSDGQGNVKTITEDDYFAEENRIYENEKELPWKLIEADTVPEDSETGSTGKEVINGDAYKCILTSSREAAERTVGDVTFSWESNYDEEKGNTGNIYVTQDGKTTLFISEMGLGANIVTDGNEVFYSIQDSNSWSIFRKDLSNGIEEYLFGVEGEYYNVGLAGYFDSTIYYIIGLDPGTLYGYEVTSQKERKLAENVTNAEQIGRYFYLTPYCGDAGGTSSLSVYDAVSGETTLISERLCLMGPREMIADTVYYLEYIDDEDFHFSPAIVSLKKCRLDGSEKKTLISNLEITTVLSITDEEITYLDERGDEQVRKFD